MDRIAVRRSGTQVEILAAAWEIAREQGLAGLTLRDVAARVGMRAPSLYSYFDSKHAIYDAMFAQGCHEHLRVPESVTPTGGPLTDLTRGTRSFVGFCTAGPVRYHLLLQRTIPGCEPTPESYTLAAAVLESLRARLAGLGIIDEAPLDLLTAIGTGLPDRRLPVPLEVDGVRELSSVASLVDTILTRDIWMHRVDICRATGREMVLTPSSSAGSRPAAAPGCSRGRAVLKGETTCAHTTSDGTSPS